MPVHLPSVSDHAAQAATLLLRGDDTTTADPGLFAACFQELLGKPLTAADTANPLTAVIDTARADDGELDADLSALLPFIEALGLTQARPTEAAAADALQSQLADTAGAALAAPLTTATALPADSPAISAANAQSRPLLQTSAPAIQSPPPVQVETDSVSTRTATAAETVPENLPGEREFSTQLVAALAANKDTPLTPGNVSAAAHQVIAQSLPAQVQAAAHGDLAIAQPVGTPGWSEEIGNRIAWLANRSESHADLVLNPPQMGRVEISLSIKGDQAAASFVSGNPVVREALEAALPRLREVLADAGIQLGQAQVSAENARQWAQQEKHGENFASDRDREMSPSAAISHASSGSLSTVAGLKAGRGLVDVFA